MCELYRVLSNSQKACIGCQDALAITNNSWEKYAVFYSSFTNGNIDFLTSWNWT